MLVCVCVCACACVCVCMCVCAHMHVYLYVYMCMDGHGVCLCVCVCVCVCVCMCVHIYEEAVLPVWDGKQTHSLPLQRCVCVCVCVCVCIYTDVKKLYYQCGVENKPTVFLFNDVQVVEESFLEDINNILSSGEVPNLYKPDELEDVSIISTIPASAIFISSVALKQSTDGSFMVF